MALVTVQVPGRSGFYKIKFTLHLISLASLFMEICDLGVIGFVAYNGATLEELNSVVVILGILIVRPELIGIGSRRVVCNADFLETRSGRIMNNHN